MSAPSPLPPPPKAGEVAAQRVHAPVTTVPPQMAIPPPQQYFAPVHGTMPNTSTLHAGPGLAGPGPGPTTINFGAVPSPAPAPGSHPPGYQQNVNAQEMSSAARAELEQIERKEGLAAGLGFGSTGDGVSGLGGADVNDTAANVWNTVTGWASAASKTLIETEKKVWDTVNKGS